MVKADASRVESLTRRASKRKWSKKPTCCKYCGMDRDTRGHPLTYDALSAHYKRSARCNKLHRDELHGRNKDKKAHAKQPLNDVNKNPDVPPALSALRRRQKSRNYDNKGAPPCSYCGQEVSRSGVAWTKGALRSHLRNCAIRKKEAISKTEVATALVDLFCRSADAPAEAKEPDEGESGQNSDEEDDDDDDDEDDDSGEEAEGIRIVI